MFRRVLMTTQQLTKNEHVRQGLVWLSDNEKIAALAATNIVGLTVGLLGYYRGTQQIGLLQQQFQLASDQLAVAREQQLSESQHLAITAHQLAIAQEQLVNESRILAVQFLRDLDTKLHVPSDGASFNDVHRSLLARSTDYVHSEAERQHIQRYLRFLGNELLFAGSQTMLPARVVAQTYAAHVDAAMLHPYVIDVLLQDTAGKFADFRQFAALLVRLRVDGEDKSTSTSMTSIRAFLDNFDQLSRECRKTATASQGDKYTLACPAAVAATKL